MHWVRKFYNIETTDIADHAVTEDKLQESLLANIKQAVENLKLSWTASSGEVTMTKTSGEVYRTTIPCATTKTAGLMSASDKGQMGTLDERVTALEQGGICHCEGIPDEELEEILK